MNARIISTGLHLRSHMHSGGKEHDWCYAERNARSLGCALNGWPQINTDLYYCRGNNNEILLKDCLIKRGEIRDWWKNFPGCTGEQQCLDLSGKWIG